MVANLIRVRQAIAISLGTRFWVESQADSTARRGQRGKIMQSRRFVVNSFRRTDRKICTSHC